MRRRIAALLWLATLPAHAQSMDLSAFLEQVRSRHQGIKAIGLSMEASDDRREAGDLSLVPVLSLKGTKVDDKRQPNFLGASTTLTDTYSLGLGKKFSTGTQVNLSAMTVATENKDMTNPLFRTAYEKFSQGSLGVSFSQSLWRDFFGAGTRLRRERESLINKSEKSSLNLQERQLLVEAEALFWDHVYLKEELRQRESSLKRAQKIENWVSRRVRDGIGDRADLLNSKALLASRELQLLSAEDEWQASQKKLREFLELSPEEKLPELQGKLVNIESRRNLRTLFKPQQKILRLDAYLAELEAKTRSTLSAEVEDSNKSDLSLAGAYNTNSYEAGGDINDARKSWTQREYPTQTVSLTWTYMFDTAVKQAAVSGARKEALAAQYRSQKKTRESELAWQELIRRNDELLRKIEAAQIISRLQDERARVEQDKLSKGRSITTNVINSEQDAAEANLTLSKLLVEQRKLEAQAQMFVAVEDL